MSSTSPPELLAPAGDWECAQAAVANGADAIYFGLDHGFNARARAVNFSLESLPKLINFLHEYGVKGYVTLNTLAFTSELETLETVVRRLANAGVDAVLVQDLGLVRLIREAAPGLEIHASTQMTLTSAECIELAARLGVARVVLARELSIDEIAAISAKSTMPVEVFAHGALCVSYSGQCLTSESLGGRSANRGQCAQACRLPYEIVVDGENVNLDDQKYLLSPQDLAAYALTPELMAAGVASLKIEGRLKTPEYVANITRHYRQAIDNAVAGKPVEFTPLEIEEMELSFSRGFSVGWLNGCDHKELVPGLSSAKRGVRIGEVSRVDGGVVHVALSGRVKAGDGVVFSGDRAANNEQGGRLFAVEHQGKRIKTEIDMGVVEFHFHGDNVDVSELIPGQAVWKTDDPALTRRLRKSYQGDLTGKPTPVKMEVFAAVNQPLRCTITAQGQTTFVCESEQSLEAARKHPLTVEVLKEQFGRLGGSGFELAELTAKIIGKPMSPLSVLGKLRKEMVCQLKAQKATIDTTRATSPEPALPKLRTEISREEKNAEQPQLQMLCRTLHQLEVMLAHDVKQFYLDFQDIREYRPGVQLAKAAGAKVFLATPRIQKPDESGIFQVMMRNEPSGMLVRNLAGIQFCTQHEIACVADYSLNVANELTGEWLLSQGVQRITASYDLNRDQLLELATQSNTSRMEVVLHQHMPMFHMEHCVFCSVLSPGTNKTNCGRPCDDHEVQLRDRVGALHPLQADVGCRNTLYNATPQSGAAVVPALLSAGVRNFRIEFLLDDTAQQLQRTYNLYQQLLIEETTPQQVWTELNAINRIGVTKGTLEHPRDPLAII